jgi:NADPH:quinone reductase-like Zn-dependent oxidoreductase
LVEGGSWSERAAVRTDRLASLPDAVTTEAAAALPIAGLTALRAVRLGGALLDAPVLVTGAAGGVGQFAVQLARSAGAHVTALVHGDRHVDEARELGAQRVVTALDDPALGPFAFVLDGVGGPVLSAALARCAAGATIALYAGGSTTEIGLSSFGPAPLARLVGFFVYAEQGTTMAEDLATLAGLVADGRLRPRLGLVRDWAATRDALEAMRTHAVSGKVVLRVDGAA